MKQPVSAVREDPNTRDMSAPPRMGTFFSYFGAKFMRAPHYPKPRHETIVEPFAGAAGYSVRHYGHRVVLVDKSPYICGVWRYLIAAKPSEILRLPLMKPGDDVRALPIPQEAQWLLAFWFNQGSSVPKRTMGGRLSTDHLAKRTEQSFGTWSAGPRARIAAQVDRIRHWRIIEGDYTLAPERNATWFVDPPYQHQGKQYPHQIDDFKELARWCRTRRGQVLVCESAGADWLPFVPIHGGRREGATHRKTTEVLWQSESGSAHPERKDPAT